MKNIKNIAARLSQFAKRAGKKTAALVLGAFAVFGMLAAGGMTAVAVAHDAKDRAEYMAEKIGRRLDLDDGQKDRLEEMLKAGAAKRQNMRAQTEEAIRTAVLRESMSKEDALRLMDLRKTRREEMRGYAAEQFAAFHAMLDGEQREKLAAMAPRLMKMLGGGKHRGGKKRGWHGGRHKNKHGWFGKHGRGDDDDDDDRDH